MAKSHILITCFLSKIDHPHYFLDQILADPVLNKPEKGIEIIVLKQMQGRSTQATRDFDVCYVFNLKIWLRTSIVL